ncbi:MAG: hypothetical protein NE334_21975 [Lentisphaeraceae bacterium]|nr:hypothetical protein [Lentisphaeraceae bacterium]
MELNTFITHTLREIVKGVAGAASGDGYVQAIGVSDHDKGMFRSSDVNFDILLSVDSTQTNSDGSIVQGSTGGAGSIKVLEVLDINLGAEADIKNDKSTIEKNNNSRSSRVKFSVPICLTNFDHVAVASPS